MYDWMHDPDCREFRKIIFRPSQILEYSILSI